MKFIGTTTKYKVNKEKMQMAVSVGMIVLISSVSIVTVKALIEAQDRIDKQKSDAQFVSLINETSDPSSEVTEMTKDTSISASLEGTENVIETEGTGNTDITTGTEGTSGEGTSATTTATEPPATTTETFTETKVVKFVYASSELNVRSGPGTSYDIVKTIDKGSGIDVIGVTDNGWYHTYNGNYVSKDLCQEEPVKIATPTPIPVQTTASQTQSATQATQPPTMPSPADNQPIEGMTYYGSCKITFYGPQPRGDGTYSTSTATGTTCCEGVTCAADWSIFPAGTVIYIPNDPLGGDGYYTVEDKGSGVKGSHIDIYADLGESYSTTSGEVYIVN